MINRIVASLIDYQIKQGILQENERNLYHYGYQMMIEYVLNILAALFIAMVLDAYGIVIIFTLTFMLIRSYTGGYHAGTGLSCFIMSAVMQIIVILGVRLICGADFPIGGVLTIEIFITPYILYKVPVAVPNRPISENERIHFRKRARIIYALELVAYIGMIVINQTEYALSILFAHLIIFILVIINEIFKLNNFEEE